MAIPRLNQRRAAWCCTAGLAASVVIGCGSSTPPAPPATPAPATTMAPASPPSMTPTAPAQPASTTPAAPGGHAQASIPGATMPGSAPGNQPPGGHAQPGIPGAIPGSTPGNQPPGAGHSQAGIPGAIPGSTPGNQPPGASAGHAQPGIPGAIPGSTQPAAGSAQANAAAMMKAHGQGGAPAGGAPNPGGATIPGTAAPANPSAPGANAAAFAPGQPGQPGNPGAGPGGGAQSFPAGSAEAALAKFCKAITDGNLTEAGEYISPKAKGLLAQIRDGSITDEKLDGLKSSFAPQDLQLRPSLRASGTGKSIKLGNSKNESLNFTLMKEEETYLLREFTISKAPAR